MTHHQIKRKIALLQKAQAMWKLVGPQYGGEMWTASIDELTAELLRRQTKRVKKTQKGRAQ